MSKEGFHITINDMSPEEFHKWMRERLKKCKYSKEELEKMFGVQMLTYQVIFINELLRIKREGKDIIYPIRTTNGEIIKIIDRICKREIKKGE